MGPLYSHRTVRYWKFTVFPTVFIFLTLTLLENTDGSRYQESCTTNPECEDTGYCNPSSKQCGCITDHSKIKQIFDADKQICVSKVGSICHLEPSTADHKFVCTKNADCSFARGTGKSTILGICKCKSSYFLTENGLCDQRREIPVREQKTGTIGVSSRTGNSESAPPPNAIPQWIRSGSTKSSVTITLPLLCALTILMTNYCSSRMSWNIYIYLIRSKY